MKRRPLKRFACGLAFFALGGTTAGALQMVRHGETAAAATPKRAAAAAPSDRIAVPASMLRQAYAIGAIDRPIKSILNVPGRMHYGDFRWDDKGVPAGPTWIRVDLDAQLLSVFRGGHEIGTAVILYGADGVETPTGKFPILAKLKDHRSATYDNAPDALYAAADRRRRLDPRQQCPLGLCDPRLHRRAGGVCRQAIRGRVARR